MSYGLDIPKRRRFTIPELMAIVHPVERLREIKEELSRWQEWTQIPGKGEELMAMRDAADIACRDDPIYGYGPAERAETQAACEQMERDAIYQILSTRERDSQRRGRGNQAKRTKRLEAKAEAKAKARAKAPTTTTTTPTTEEQAAKKAKRAEYNRTAYAKRNQG